MSARTRRRREVETSDYLKMAVRILRAAGRRVAFEDYPDLADLCALRTVLDDAITVAVAGHRARGCSWDEVARGLGMTRQGAWQRYGRNEPRESLAGVVRPVPTVDAGERLLVQVAS